MKKLSVMAIALVILFSVSTSSCIGSFSLTNKLLAWNKTINNKFVNELVFFAFLIVPVYEVSALADILVLNSIEFWSGSSPVAQSKSIIQGNDGKYLVECDGKGYTITSLTDSSKTRLNFHAEEQTWTLQGSNGVEWPLITFVDATHVRVPSIDGQMQLVELKPEAMYAFQCESVK